MPKTKAVIDADTNAAINIATIEPILTPLEDKCVQELIQPTLDAINKQAETPADEDLQQIQALEDAMAEVDQKIILTEDRLAMLKSQKKEIKEQYLDALKKKRALYKSRLQNTFDY